MIEESAKRLARFLEATVSPILARAFGHDSLSGRSLDDLTTYDRDIACLTGVPYAGVLDTEANMQRFVTWALLAVAGCGGATTDERSVDTGDEAARDEAGEAPEEVPVEAPIDGHEPEEITRVPVPPDVAAPPSDAARTASGLWSRVLRAGTGEAHPTATDRVTVHYSGWTTDGHMFDSSVVNGETATFSLGFVIPGWTEGMQLMVVGEQRRLWIPENLAYQGREGTPRGMLVFDVELLAFEAAPPTPPVPDDVAAAPRNAQRTASGLASRVLRAGTGLTHPTEMSTVRFHLTGWTADGTMFDSTVTRAEPLDIQLERLAIAGLREGIPLMVVGERRRFWVPEALGFEGRPGTPAGTLVFDIELIETRETAVDAPVAPP